ncbi:MAG TPA: hypothetical protein VGF40_02415 [Thermoanaerobaculia bacterium]
MSAENVRVAKEAATALKALSGSDRDAAFRALGVIAGNPIVGAPLFEPLRGFWVLREGRVRIVYRVSRDGSMAGVVLVDVVEEES